MKRFSVPRIGFKDISVDIIDNPLELLEQFFSQYKEGISDSKKRLKGYDYVMLPLYSVRHGIVPEKSGLNQWNAGGRKRDEDEVYIPVPIYINKNYPTFFPERDNNFTLLLPDGTALSAKICQDNNKALMSNPNKALGHWILRKLLKKKPGELVTMDDLNRFGFDSVCVENLHSVNEKGEKLYRISFASTSESYKDFIDLE